MIGGHVFANYEHRQELYADTVAWFAEHL